VVFVAFPKALRHCGLHDVLLQIWEQTNPDSAMFVLQVPRSSNKLAEDNEYALFTVVLFKKIADTFKTHAREKGFQVGPFFCYCQTFMSAAVRRPERCRCPRELASIVQTGDCWIVRSGA
jgi:hypothetical protein